MKAKFLFLILLFSNFLVFGQDPKITTLKESKLKIINLNIDANPNQLPLLAFTILNKTKNNFIFNKIVLELIEFKKNPTSSSTNNGLISKVLTPIAGIDLTIPEQEDIYLYSLNTPFQIVGKDAATIQIRIHALYKNKNVVPSQLGEFKFKLLFVTYDSKAIQSNEITLGN
jgi:hypothetical protein